MVSMHEVAAGQFMFPAPPAAAIMPVGLQAPPAPTVVWPPVVVTEEPPVPVLVDVPPVCVAEDRAALEPVPPVLLPTPAPLPLPLLLLDPPQATALTQAMTTLATPYLIKFMMRPFGKAGSTPGGSKISLRVGGDHGDRRHVPKRRLASQIRARTD